MFLATSFMICNGYGLKGQNRCKTKSRSFVSGVFVMATFLLGAALYYEATAATSPVSYAAGGVFSPYASLQNFPYVTLTSPNAQLGGAFGYSVATSGSIVVVGAIFSEEHAYIFDAKNGGLINTLTSPTAEPFGGFGVSVATNGNIVVVGANLQTANGQMRAGHAYTFNATTGSLISMLTSPNAQLEGDFGYSVGASGDLVVVGAPFETADGQGGAGHTYTFNAVTGILISTLTSPNVQVGSGFGMSVAASGNTLVIGAPFEAVTAFEQSAGHAGHAYASRLAPATGSPDCSKRCED